MIKADIKTHFSVRKRQAKCNLANQNPNYNQQMFLETYDDLGLQQLYSNLLL